MSRRPILIPTETVDAMLAGVAAGSSLAEMCRRYQLARGTVGDHLSRDPALAVRLNEAKAAGRLARTARPRRRRAAAPAGVAQPLHGPAASQPSPITPRPPAATPAPAAGQIPVARVADGIVYLDIAGVARVLGQVLDVAAQAEPHR